MHAVIPRLTRVEVDFPAAVSVFSCCPVWYSESLVQDSWSSIEGYVADALDESVRVEVLCIHMHVNERFLMEFVSVHIFNSDTCSIIIN